MTKALWSLLPIPPSWHWGCFLSKTYKTNYKRLKQECPLFCFLQQESWRTWGQSWGLACVYKGPWLFLNVSDVPPCWAVGVRLCSSRGYIPIFRWAFVFIRERFIVRIPKMRKSSREYNSKDRSTISDYYAAKVDSSSKVKERKQ